MDGKTQELRERWKRRTDAAFERMFAGKSDEELRTLSQRETMAELIGRELSAFLLEEHVATDATARPPDGLSACCPKCGQAGQRAVEKEKLPTRSVVTRVGQIEIRRQRWSCAKCRIIFFPLDERLELGTEGYSPVVLAQAVRQASKAASFAEASDDLLELAHIEISPTHLQRVSERIGKEWCAARDNDVEKFRRSQLERTHKEASPGAAAVMLDGGRVQTRADDGEGPGVREAGWRETKVACCLTLQTKAAVSDPHPEPPAKFLEPTTVARVAAEIKRRGSAAAEESEERTKKKDSSSHRRQRRRKRQRSLPKRLRKKKVSRTRVRTVVATMENSDTFGWQVAAEVHRRGLDQVKRKACVCDGQAYNWSVYEMHLRPLDFIPILDFVHLVAYLYDAAQACGGSPSQAWQRYERWLRWAWSGKVSELLSQLRAAAAQSNRSPREGKTILDETITYVTNNRQRMDYPEYRRLGLPISSAPVESTIKQINRRVKGSEKFWLTTGAEAMLQLRSAQLSQDDRWRRNWQRRRPHHRAAASHRLSQAC